jgi:hypothetical protein
MKKLFPLLLSLFLSATTFAQNPDLYSTWYLYSYKNDSGDVLFTSDIDPAIVPTLTIENDLSYNGNAACNGYDGSFTFDPANDQLIMNSFVRTFFTCTFSSHIQFESDYFEYFQVGVSYEYVLLSNFLYLELEPGAVLTYGREPLSVDDFNSVNLEIYPNPVFETLYIQSGGLTIESFSVYSIEGRLVHYQNEFSGSIDISGLSKGLYLLEILTENNKQTKKFIKK